MRKAGKKDLNQAAIVAALRAIGCEVLILNQEGVPDLLVGHRRKNWLLEVKTARGHLTEPQKRFFGRWCGQATVVRSVPEALLVFGVD
jgi:hypothetical protein